MTKGEATSRKSPPVMARNVASRVSMVLGVVDGLKILGGGEEVEGVLYVVFDALATGKLNFADGGVGKADGHVVSAALEAAGEVGEGAILLLGHGIGAGGKCL